MKNNKAKATKTPKANPAAQRLAQALQWHNQGQLSTAEGLYKQALALQPNNAEALHYYGVLHMQQGDYEQGVALIQQSLQHAESLDARANLASGFIHLHRHLEALQHLDSVLAQNPRLANAHTNRGIVLNHLGRVEEAAQAHRMALQIQPIFPEALHYLGDAERTLGRHEAAIELLQRALQLRPKQASTYHSLGMAQALAHQYEAALQSYDQSLSLRPGHIETFCNQLISLKMLNRQAEAHQRLAVKLAEQPENAALHQVLGYILASENRHHEAIAAFDQALARQTDYLDARWNRCHSHFLLGKIDIALPDYELRFKLPQADRPRPFTQPHWDGRESLQGKRILIWAEQGLGDSLQFSRYLPLLAEQGAEVWVEIQAPLAPLIAQIPGVSRVFALENPLKAADPATAEADFQCPMLSLLQHFPWAYIPPQPLFTPDPERRQKWAAQFTSPPLALCISGNPKLRHDNTRSIPLASFAPLFAKHPDVILIQKQLRDSDRQTLTEWQAQGLPCPRLISDELEDFADTTALLSACRQLISVDTSVAHLAASINLPTQLLVAFTPDWRWQLDRLDSPWYPSITLQRQTTLGDWDAVIAKLVNA